MHYNLQGGQQTGLFGQAHAPASHLAQQEIKKEKTMNDTSGQSGLNLSSSAALQQSLESRLKARLPTGGLTMFIKGWKQKVTPAGRQYYQLAVSVRPIKEIDCSLWATPNTMDHLAERSYAAMKRQATNGGRKGRTFLGNLREQVSPLMCQAYRDAMIENGKIPVMWPTPNANKHTKNSQDPQKMKEGGVQTCLADAAWIASKAMWPTPNASDNRDRGSFHSPCIQRRITKGKQIGLTMLAQGCGKEAHGLTAQTGNKGSLNPQFPCWLMGFPQEWLNCVGSVTPSSRKLRRNLSDQISLEEMMK